MQVLVSIIPDHQASLEDTFAPDLRPPPHPFLVEVGLGGLDNWDAEYYLLIADRGYMHEQTLAFFPLYPMLMRVVSVPLSPLFLLLPPRSVYLICGVCINMAAFSTAAVLLYLLTMETTHHRQLSLLSAALFCLTPASVFMSAVYTESLFVCFSLAGMLSLQRSSSLFATLCFSLASSTRSNGTVLAGFLIYHHLLKLIHSCKCREAFQTVFTAAVQVLLVVLPFLLFQAYGYLKFCASDEAEEERERPTAPHPPWCSWSLPLSYSSVQSRYWGLGFLHYYQWKQLPNFLLATPMVLLVSHCLWRYCTSVGGVVFITQQLLGGRRTGKRVGAL